MKDPELVAALVGETDVVYRRRVALMLIGNELDRAQWWPAMNSAHEGWAVLAEEVDELWDHVKVRQGERDIPEMAYEAVQVAAMALRFLIDVCRTDTARK